MPAWSQLRSLTEAPLLDDCPHAGRLAILVVALRKLLPRRAFEAGLPCEGKDPFGDNIGLVQLVQVPARDGRGGPTEGQSGDQGSMICCSVSPPGRGRIGRACAGSVRPG